MDLGNPVTQPYCLDYKLSATPEKPIWPSVVTLKRKYAISTDHITWPGLPSRLHQEQWVACTENQK